MLLLKCDKRVEWVKWSVCGGLMSWMVCDKTWGWYVGWMGSGVNPFSSRTQIFSKPKSIYYGTLRTARSAR